MGEGTRDDLTGRTFGRLTVLGRDPVKNERGRAWACRCECGGTPPRSPVTVDLTTGRVTSCGCDRPGGPRRLLSLAPDRREAFAARHRAGASLRELRDEFGLTSREVARQWLRRLGLTPHPSGRKRE